MKHSKMNGRLSQKAYKFTIFEILRGFFVLRVFFCIIIYCVSVLFLHIESTDSITIIGKH